MMGVGPEDIHLPGTGFRTRPKRNFLGFSCSIIVSPRKRSVSWSLMSVVGIFRVENARFDSERG
jgi:hypothetical protein